MAVEEVNVPPKVVETDPRQQKEKKQDDATYWEGKAKAERAKREFLEERQLQDRLENPPAPQEAPFKISGSVNLGNIDVQENQKRIQEEATAARKETQEKIDQLTQEKDVAEKALHDARLAHVQQQLTAQIEQLKAMISSGDGNRKPVIEQLNEVETLAQKLGYAKPGTALPSTTDAMVLVELKKLEIQLNREKQEYEDRRLDRQQDYERQKVKDEREWQIQLKQLDQDAKEIDAKLQAEKDKMAMWASAPERVGAVIAKGMMQGTAEGRAVSAQNRQTFHLECAPGESGEVECPNCKTPIGIGPSARGAVCVGCNSRIAIKRVAPGQVPAEAE